MKKPISAALIVAILTLAVPLAGISQRTALTNAAVTQMVKDGVATEIIVAKIKSSQTAFDTSTESLTSLKQAGIPDAVVLAMVESGAHATSASTAQPAAADPVDVKVVDGVQIEVELSRTASGEDLKVGDIVDFTVTQPVVVEGVTVIDKGAPARATITTAKRGGHWGHAGKLEWAMKDVMTVSGERIPVRFTQRLAGDSKGGTVAVAAVATTVLLGPLGLLWGLKKGKPAIIPAGNRYPIFVHGDTTVKGKKPVTAE